MGGDAGNIIDKTGYACMLKTLTSTWVQDFSAVPGTTSPAAPFGVVTLADGGWEGNPANAGQMHWAETLNYGVMPNPACPNCFVATAHDVGDPWNEQECRRANCCNDNIRPNISAGCSGDTRWMVTAAKEDPKHPGHWINDLPPLYPSTPMLMSSVHPRTKAHVGQRLAAAAWNVAYGHTEQPASGPVIAGCSVVGSKIIIAYNTTLLGTDAVLFKGYNKSNRASAMEVLVGTPFPFEYADGNSHKGPKVMDSPPWQNADIAAGSAPNTIEVDLSAFEKELASGEVTGVRYARWAVVSHPLCCGDVDFSTTPCPPNSCPISGSKSDLPAMPFEAQIVNGKCKCLAPQTCDGG